MAFLAFRLFKHKIPSECDFKANMGPCWRQHRPMLAQKNLLGTSWAVLEASWAVLPRSRGGSGEAHAPQHCKGIDPRGVLRRFEASSRPLGGRNPTTCLQRWRFWGGPNRVLSEDPSSDPRPLKGILSKGRSLNPGTPSGQAR